jgi:hypothetical protein
MVKNCVRFKQLPDPCHRVTVLRKQHGALAMILHGQFEKNKLFIKELGV